DEGVSKASGVDDQERPESSTPNINTAGPSTNTVSLIVLTTRSNCPQTVLDVFSLRNNVTPEATNVDLFCDETELDMSNLNASYQVPTTPNTRIHKDHSLDQVIGDIQSGVQTRGMTKTANEQGFLSAVYERKTHDDLNTSKIKAIRLFLAYASFMGFMVNQIDVKSAFLYGQINEEVYVCQPPGFKDPDYPDKVYKVVKALYGLHQAPRACQDKYVAKILRKFNYTDVKTASTPVDVDVHLYRSMIGSLMYLTSSRLDIMFAVCACARFQVTIKTSHLLDVKRIFRYLKAKPSLGLWYSRDSPFELVAYTDSDYAGATQDRKSTTEGCQFLGTRLISWQCKKQTVVATSTTKAEYVAAASCCGQVLRIQNHLLDYGYNFMNTVIHIDNNSTICSIENPVEHAKTKHIEIRHHFIRDCNAKKLIQMAKIDIEHNVADLLTKAFNAGRFQYLVSSIGMLNP
ncbi:putative reverse transcriptase, RNA-dependent DNA polymerase, partial [Tanacetum coccineum]